MKQILKSISEQSSQKNQSTRSSSEVSIIYCHADIKGALMNDGWRSKEGLEITDFPSKLPIYSGHFHKPHVVRILIA